MWLDFITLPVSEVSSDSSSDMGVIVIDGPPSWIIRMALDGKWNDVSESDFLPAGGEPINENRA